MFSGIVQGGTKALGGARFSLVNLMPAAFLITFVTVLITSGAYTSPKPSLASVIDTLDKNPGLAVAAAFGIFLAAVLLRPFQAALVQFLEGYWRGWPLLEFANELGTERHRRIQNTAEIMLRVHLPQQPIGKEFADVADYARRVHKVRRRRGRASMIAERYPRDIQGQDRLMPTLLGNTLRDGEDNAGRRYGLYMPIVYPRMYPCLSAKLDGAISTQLDMLDTTSALCVAFGLSAIFSLPLVAHLNWWSLTPLVAMFMSALAYRGAVATAHGHGRLLATAFDLHRFDMLNALHYELPVTVEDELDLNRSLSTFLESRDTDAVLRMRRFRYRHPTTLAGGDAQPPDPAGATGD